VQSIGRTGTNLNGAVLIGSGVCIANVYFVLQSTRRSDHIGDCMLGTISRGGGLRTMQLLGKTILAVILSMTLNVSPARSAGLDVSQYRGKLVYLDFWASWCAPCRQSFPWLSDLVRRYGARNFVVIGVNVDQDRARAERFLSETPANFPIIYDPHGDIATDYKVTGMPSAVLIDRDGRVRFQHNGFSVKRKDLYEEHVQTLLSEPH
jgi:cytochrome c biogenesis protein CcmG, thiol:disulfide interchange protein DsbE